MVPMQPLMKKGPGVAILEALTNERCSANRRDPPRIGKVEGGELKRRSAYNFPYRCRW